MSRTVLVMLLIGCGNRNSGKCSDAARHLVDHMLELRAVDGKPSMNDQDKRKATEFSTLLAERCSADGWTDDAIKCFDIASSANEADRCVSMLSELQLKKLEADPKAQELFGPAEKPVTKQDIAELVVKKYAFEAYPSWSQQHPTMACPKRLEDLNEYMNNKDVKDPWGSDYRMYCGSTLPPGAKGLGVASPGEDGKIGTADDIRSW